MVSNLVDLYSVGEMATAANAEAPRTSVFDYARNASTMRWLEYVSPPLIEGFSRD